MPPGAPGLGESIPREPVKNVAAAELRCCTAYVLIHPAEKSTDLVSQCDGNRPTCSRCLDRGVRCLYSTAEDGRQPAPKSYVVMLRNRIQLLERVLQAHGIDADASIAQLSATGDSPEQPPDSGGTLASNVHELSLTFDGALTLDESLNFDQDGEVRYFGPSSGRMLFRSPGNGKPTFSLVDLPMLIMCRFTQRGSHPNRRLLHWLL